MRKINKCSLGIVWMIGILFCWTNEIEAQHQSDDEIHDKILKAFNLSYRDIKESFRVMDEVQMQLKSNPNSKQKGYYYQVMSYLYRNSNEDMKFDSAYNKAIYHYTLEKDDLGVSMLLLEKGTYFLYKGMLDTASIYYHKSFEIKKDLKDDEGLSLVYNGLGAIEDYKGNYLNALNYYLKSLETGGKDKKANNTSDTYHNISIIHYNLGNMDKAIEYQNKAIAINRTVGNKYGESMNYICVSAFLLEMDSIDRALYFAQSATELTKKQDNHAGILYALVATGDVYLKTKDFKNALQYYNQFLGKFIADSDDPYMKAQVLEKKGRILLAQNDFLGALALFRQAEPIYIANSNAKEMYDITTSISKCYKGMGNVAMSFKYLEQSVSWRDSVFNQAKVKDLLQLEAKFKVKEQTLENERLVAEQALKESKIASQQTMLYGGGVGIALISMLSLLLYNQSRKRKQLNQTLTTQKDQIQTLNSELNHRVKNNLAFMTSLLEMQGRRSTNEETKTALKESESRLKALALVHSQLFRSDSDTEVNLRDYLNEVIHHLSDIFSTSQRPITFKTDFKDYQINAEDAMRLGLIVNELVTNSVKHAFHNVTNPVIRVKTHSSSDGRLMLDYHDGGIRNPATMDDQQASQSLGLKLISLLKQQLGDRYVVVG